MANCSTCQARIIWTISPAGAKLCLDARTWEELEAEGNLIVMTSPMRYVTEPVDAQEAYGLQGRQPELQAVKYDPDKHEGRPVYVSHWPLCPTREQHRRKR